MKIYDQADISRTLNISKAVTMIEQGFVNYDLGKVQTPPVQNLLFPDDNGDCCVKTAWVEGEETFTVKIATGFYDNPALGLSSNSGMMLVLSARTGKPLALLNDGGWLTAIRTAIAGQLMAKHLAPSLVSRIGIFGTGMQARLQLEYLLPVTTCRDVIVWGRSPEALEEYRIFAETLGLRLVLTQDAEEVANTANLIVTTTPSREALLATEWIKPGTHITAVGADALGKQELAPELVANADLVVVDSVSQCVQYGEISHAFKAGLLDESKLISVGEIIRGARPGRTDQRQITIGDLTGVGMQDAQISRCAIDSFSTAESCPRYGGEVSQPRAI